MAPTGLDIDIDGESVTMLTVPSSGAARFSPPPASEMQPPSPPKKLTRSQTEPVHSDLPFGAKNDGLATSSVQSRRAFRDRSRGRSQQPRPTLNSSISVSSAVQTRERRRSKILRSLPFGSKGASKDIPLGLKQEPPIIEEVVPGSTTGAWPLSRVGSLSSKHPPPSRTNSVPIVSSVDHSAAAKIAALQQEANLLRTRQLLLSSLIPGDGNAYTEEMHGGQSEKKESYYGWLRDIADEKSQLEQNRPPAFNERVAQLDGDEKLLMQLWNTDVNDYVTQDLFDQWARCSGWIKRLLKEQSNIERNIMFYSRLMPRPYQESSNPSVVSVLSQSSGPTPGMQDSPRASISTESPLLEQFEPNESAGGISGGGGWNSNNLFPSTASISPTSETPDAPLKSAARDKSPRGFGAWARRAREVSPAIFISLISLGIMIVHQKDVIEVILHQTIDIFFSGITLVIAIVGTIGAGLFLLRIVTSKRWQVIFPSSSQEQTSRGRQPSAMEQQDFAGPVYSRRTSTSPPDDDATVMDSYSPAHLPGRDDMHFHSAPLNISSPSHSIFSSPGGVEYTTSTARVPITIRPQEHGPFYSADASLRIPDEKYETTSYAAPPLSRQHSSSKMVPMMPSASYSSMGWGQPSRRTLLEYERPAQFMHTVEGPTRSLSVRAPKHLFADQAKVLFRRREAAPYSNGDDESYYEDEDETNKHTSLTREPSIASSHSPSFDGYVDENACKPYGPPPTRYQGALT